MAPDIPVKPLPVTEMVSTSNGSVDICGSLTLEDIDYLNAENTADQAAKLLR